MAKRSPRRSTTKPERRSVDLSPVIGSLLASGAGSYPVQGTATDVAGNTGTSPASGPGSGKVTVNVNNGPLTISGLTPPAATEGIAWSSGAVPIFHFTADPAVTLADYTATIEWGDGTSSTMTATGGGIAANPGGGFDVFGSHTYADELSGGTFSVLVTDAGWARRERAKLCGGRRAADRWRCHATGGDRRDGLADGHAFPLYRREPGRNRRGLHGRDRLG